MTGATWNTRDHKAAAFLAGILAAMLMTIIMLLLLITGVTPRSLPNLLSDKIAAIPGGGFTEILIQAIGKLGKELLFLTIIIGQVLLGGLVGFLLALVTGPVKSARTIWRNSLLMSGGLWLVFMLVVFPLVEAGFFGTNLGNDQFYILLSTFLLFILFGLALALVFRLLATPQTARLVRPAADAAPAGENVKAAGPRGLNFGSINSTTRRDFVAAVSLVFVGTVGVIFWPKIRQPAHSPFTDRPNFGLLTANNQSPDLLTSTENHYVVSKNAFDPVVNGANWQLEIDGLVERPLKFSLADLQKMTRQTVNHTLVCVSNPVGGDLMSTARWSGVAMRDLLGQAGVKPGVVRAMFTGADGYTDSIPIEKALESGTLLVFEMNGAALPLEHGYPVRALVPDIYGMKNAKWLTRITLITEDFKGYWQKQGWNNIAQIHTLSTIVWPSPTDQLKAGQAVQLRGVAFAGSRPIEKVEVSTDNGATWQAARLSERLGPHAWTLWQLEWTPAQAATAYNLVVRAFEAGNKVQTTQMADTFPDGSSGYHRVVVRTV